MRQRLLFRSREKDRSRIAQNPILKCIPVNLLFDMFQGVFVLEPGI
jgi:hypothetical protein